MVCQFPKKFCTILNFLGIIKIIAGTGVRGHVDGPALEATFTPNFVSVDQRDGSCYISETNNHLIRRISPDGTTFVHLIHNFNILQYIY